MSTVRLCSITGKQFLSFYEPFEFNLTNWEGKTLQIDGNNRDDDGAESNGAGKSALIELIGWVWYGELCRKLRYKNNVVHKLGKECQGMGTAIIDGVDYRVERNQGNKGSQELYVFNHNGELWQGSTTSIKQQKLEELLGMNFLAFQCMVMFGHEFMSFPDLVPSERARVLTELRGLERYVQASKQCTDRVKVIQAHVQGFQEQLISVEATIEQLRKTDYKPNITQYEENRKAEIKEIQVEIETNEKALKAIIKDKKIQSDKIQAELDVVTKSIKANEKSLGGKDKLRDNLESVRRSIDKTDIERKTK
jgi:DNA repair exonuclease SbcCD ATPase subunit